MLRSYNIPKIIICITKLVILQGLIFGFLQASNGTKVTICNLLTKILQPNTVADWACCIKETKFIDFIQRTAAIYGFIIIQYLTRTGKNKMREQNVYLPQTQPICK